MSKKEKAAVAIVRTDQELRQIAVDLIEGKIFCDRHLKLKGENERMLLSVFMPLSLWEDAVEWVKDAGMIYEYLSEALPRTINGYPMFTSCQKLTIEDTDKMFALYNELWEIKKNFLKG